MCIGIPCRILSIGDGIMPMGNVEAAGELQNVCMAYVPEAKVGDYVVIQNGFAMNLLSAEEAKLSLETWADLGVLDGRATTAVDNEETGAGTICD